MKAKGFTLVEILTVVAIIGILSAIAIPQYSEYVRKAALNDATSGLSDAKTRLEQFYQDNRSYASGADCGYVPPDNERFDFTCALDDVDQGFTLTATGLSGRVKDFVYTLDETGCKGTTSLPADWGSVPSNADCDSREPGDNPRWITRKES